MFFDFVRFTLLVFLSVCTLQSAAVEVIEFLPKADNPFNKPTLRSLARFSSDEFAVSKFPNFRGVNSDSVLFVRNCGSELHRFENYATNQKWPFSEETPVLRRTVFHASTIFGDGNKLDISVAKYLEFLILHKLEQMEPAIVEKVNRMGVKPVSKMALPLWASLQKHRASFGCILGVVDVASMQPLSDELLSHFSHGLRHSSLRELNSNKQLQNEVFGCKNLLIRVGNEDADRGIVHSVRLQMAATLLWHFVTHVATDEPRKVFFFDFTEENTREEVANRMLQFEKALDTELGLTVPQSNEDTVNAIYGRPENWVHPIQMLNTETQVAPKISKALGVDENQSEDVIQNDGVMEAPIVVVSKNVSDGVEEWKINMLKKANNILALLLCFALLLSGGLHIKDQNRKKHVQYTAAADFFDSESGRKQHGSVVVSANEMSAFIDDVSERKPCSNRVPDSCCLYVCCCHRRSFELRKLKQAKLKRDTINRAHQSRMRRLRSRTYTSDSRSLRRVVEDQIAANGPTEYRLSAADVAALSKEESSSYDSDESSVDIQMNPMTPPNSLVSDCEPVPFLDDFLEPLP